MTVGTTVTGVTLFCGIVITCCALFIRFFEPAPVLTVVQENPVAVVVTEEDPQPISQTTP